MRPLRWYFKWLLTERVEIPAWIWTLVYIAALLNLFGFMLKLMGF